MVRSVLAMFLSVAVAPMISSSAFAACGIDFIQDGRFASTITVIDEPGISCDEAREDKEDGGLGLEQVFQNAWETCNKWRSKAPHKRECRVGDGE